VELPILPQISTSMFSRSISALRSRAELTLGWWGLQPRTWQVARAPRSTIWQSRINKPGATSVAIPHAHFADFRRDRILLAAKTASLRRIFRLVSSTPDLEAPDNAKQPGREPELTRRRSAPARPPRLLMILAIWIATTRCDDLSGHDFIISRCSVHPS
jgi:hypothetical protein